MEHPRLQHGEGEERQQDRADDVDEDQERPRVSGDARPQVVRIVSSGEASTAVTSAPVSPPDRHGSSTQPRTGLSANHEAERGHADPSAMRFANSLPQTAFPDSSAMRGRRSDRAMTAGPGPNRGSEPQPGVRVPTGGCRG